MIKLPNHCVAVYGFNSTIDIIIDTECYQLITRISFKDYDFRERSSSLHLLNNGTFVFFNQGCFCQISSTTYEVMFNVETSTHFDWEIYQMESIYRYW